MILILQQDSHRNATLDHWEIPEGDVTVRFRVDVRDVLYAIILIQQFGTFSSGHTDKA